MAVTVIKGGLETTVQDYPGRKGAFGMGFPPSGPIDHWSFRLANILVGNAPGAPRSNAPSSGRCCASSGIWSSRSRART